LLAFFILALQTPAPRHEDCRQALDAAAVSFIEPGQQGAIDVEHTQ
jgi:hypothetical protein